MSPHWCPGPTSREGPQRLPKDAISLRPLCVREVRRSRARTGDAFPWPDAFGSSRSRGGPEAARGPLRSCRLPFTVVDGDLLDQSADAIVNAWNRNVIPWWLLLPQGVSGAIKRRAGLAPFRELGRCGPIPLGSGVVTGAGALPYRAIIHVAGIDMLWRATPESVADSVRTALSLARSIGARRLAMPVIGAGSGGMQEAASLEVIVGALKTDARDDQDVVVVRYRR